MGRRHKRYSERLATGNDPEPETVRQYSAVRVLCEYSFRQPAGRGKMERD
jgi:hypothetical protein